MGEPEVLKQRDWTPETLRAAGFKYYKRRKQVVMARELSEDEAPKTIKAPWATLVAEAGVMIVYNPSYRAHKNLDDYEHWPVQPDLFAETYAPWDEPFRTSSPAEMHLLKMGCQPYFKITGAWAKQVEEPTYIQSLESPEPIHLPPGAWLCIGTHGEPWAQEDGQFRNRYVAESPSDEAPDFPHQHAAGNTDDDDGELGDGGAQKPGSGQAASGG